MNKEKKICPFKRRMRISYRNGERTMFESFIKCDGSVCMAYKDGICLRLEESYKKER